MVAFAHLITILAVPLVVLGRGIGNGKTLYQKHFNLELGLNFIILYV